MENRTILKSFLKLVSYKYSDPMTPADTKKMDGWDDMSKAIVESITDQSAVDGLESECTHMHGEGVEECVTYDRVIEEDGKIAVRQITRIFDDGKEVSKKYHRSWIVPGDDTENVDVMSRAIARKLHTKDVIDKFKAKLVKLKKLNT